jgi:hypothetical protein
VIVAAVVALPLLPLEQALFHQLVEPPAHGVDRAIGAARELHHAGRRRAGVVGLLGDRDQDHAPDSVELGKVEHP